MLNALSTALFAIALRLGRSHSTAGRAAGSSRKSCRPFGQRPADRHSHDGRCQPAQKHRTCRPAPLPSSPATNPRPPSSARSNIKWESHPPSGAGRTRTRLILGSRLPPEFCSSPRGWPIGDDVNSGFCHLRQAGGQSATDLRTCTTPVGTSSTPERWFFGRQRRPQRKRTKVKAYPYRGNVQRLTLPATLSRGAAPKVGVLERESDEVAGCGPMSRRYGASTVRASLAPTSGRLGSANCFTVGCTRVLSGPACSAVGWGRAGSFAPAPGWRQGARQQRPASPLHGCQTS